MNYFITINDITNFESYYDSISRSCIVFGLTDWSNHLSNPSKYRNVKNAGNKVFPDFSIEAVAYLLQKDIVGIGIDTLSPDGSNDEFPVHEAVLVAGCYILENLCNLEHLPAMGARITALPLKIEYGAEAPCRVIASL